jgi:hypothetical protein
MIFGYWRKEKIMTNIISGHVIICCAVCGKEYKRKATRKDYLGKIKMPVGWGYLRILSDFTEFCDNLDCQNVLDKSTLSSHGRM